MPPRLGAQRQHPQAASKTRADIATGGARGAAPGRCRPQPRKPTPASGAQDRRSAEGSGSRAETACRGERVLKTSTAGLTSLRGKKTCRRRIARLARGPRREAAEGRPARYRERVRNLSLESSWSNAPSLACPISSSLVWASSTDRICTSICMRWRFNSAISSCNWARRL